MGPRPLSDNLKKPTALESDRYRYEANLVDRIIVPGDISGLVGIRRWRLKPGMHIGAVYRALQYSSSVIWADKVPTAANSSGIYAYLPQATGNILCEPGIREGVIGVVELTRQVVIHEDGTLRGERCRILMFFAHSEFAARLSRIYGVPAMTVDCDAEAQARIISWLCSREGVTLLKRNTDLVSDIQAEKLLSQVDSLRDNGRIAAPADCVRERSRDRGRVMGDGTETANKACSYCFTLIVRNAALEERCPGNPADFTHTYGCTTDGTISVLQERSPAALNEPMAELLAGGLSQEEDYVLLEPVCSRCRPSAPIAKRRLRKIRLSASWLRNEVAWLNANTAGHFYWRESVRKAKSPSQSETKREHGITGWIKSVFAGQ